MFNVTSSFFFILATGNLANSEDPYGIPHKAAFHQAKIKCNF